MSFQSTLVKGKRKKLVCLVVFFQECDQVHVEDVASDDNGQELRCDDYLITHILALLQPSS